MVVLQHSMDILKAEPDSYSGSCLTSDGVNQAIDIKVKEDPDVKEEKDPLAVTFSSIKSEHEVSLVCV
jgi:hypothetical protein